MSIEIIHECKCKPVIAELLAALQCMLEQFTKTPSTLKDSEARAKAHAAIAKAKAVRP